MIDLRVFAHSIGRHTSIGIKKPERTQQFSTCERIDEKALAPGEFADPLGSPVLLGLLPQSKMCHGELPKMYLKSTGAQEAQ